MLLEPYRWRRCEIVNGPRGKWTPRSIFHAIWTPIVKKGLGSIYYVRPPLKMDPGPFFWWKVDRFKLWKMDSHKLDPIGYYCNKEIHFNQSIKFILKQTLTDYNSHRCRCGSTQANRSPFLSNYVSCTY